MKEAIKNRNKIRLSRNKNRRKMKWVKKQSVRDWKLFNL